ncbi:TetR/AcrR family transcriptional regulator [Tsukamurella ocularis]|uniref:TetR/AcrR family transcriptional regulator n=1 Tax=Tsukamurella ocularis TaxID=1970234 RepID=UPI00216A82E2|nr:TetR/AcrR family transcriptional regulator [Tsukamurella ocularis]MCS3780712.1 AcrR family transcriptional regulator [Tsukamurella ocularis]MCS3786536.1 AcrR family transcriptional regulator [Tsukamurella ocularis]MCS3850378.1 AcrR family transcriptional regulator [Tsukamurella ocularis]
MTATRTGAARQSATGQSATGQSATGRLYGGADARTRHAERLARLEEAGLDLFATAGYQQTTVADVCERAKVSRRHFYEQFADREALLRHLHTGLQQRGRVAVETALAEGMSRVGGLPTAEARRALVLAGVRAYIDAVLTDPRGLRVAFVEVVGVSPEMERYRLDNRAGWAALVRSAVEAVGSRAVAPWVYAAFIPSVNEFLLAWWQRADEGANPAELVDVLSSVLTNLLETAPADRN